MKRSVSLSITTLMTSAMVAAAALASLPASAATGTDAPADSPSGTSQVQTSAGENKADVNGDGRADIVGFGYAGTYVSLGTPSGNFTPAQLFPEFGYSQGWRVDQHPRLLGDVNGDGRADIVGFGNAGTYISLGTAAGSFTPAQFFGQFGYNQGWRVDQYPRQLADVNGDGRADIVGYGYSGTYIALGTPWGNFTPAQFFGQFGYVDGWRVDLHPRQLADVNGDGRADIVGNGYAGTYISLGTPSGNFTPAQFFGQFGYVDGWRVDLHPRQLADVNGDGRADLVGYGYAGTYVSLGTPWGSFTPAQFFGQFGYNQGWRVDQYPRQLADVNGDGRADIVGYGYSGTYIALGTPWGNFAPAQFFGQFGYVDGWRVDLHPRLLGDVNGDGRADIVGFGYAGTYISLGTAWGNFTPAQFFGQFGYNTGWRVDLYPRLLAG
ncbi:MAG: hypothetical protein JWO93_2799 [Micrococcaceae bacterium]|nr:hypothetical protein [Micrococcaceae bacterium]